MEDVVLATFAGMWMVATALFMSQMGAINNNAIGIEIAKFQADHSTSLQSYGDIDTLIHANNGITEQYSNLAIGCFAISLIIGVIAILFALKE